MAAFSIVAAKELERYGVTGNAIAPAARTRMTVDLMGEPPADRDDPFAPANVAPLVAWLCSSEAAAVTGRVFEVSGDKITVCNSWSRGARARNGRARCNPAELGPVVENLLADEPDVSAVVA